MRSLFAFLTAAAFALGTPAAALAAEPSPVAAPATADDCADNGDAPCPKPNIELGARVGYAVPLGNALEGTKLGALADGQVPLWIDAGLRLDPHWYVGVYGQIAYLLPADGVCPPGASCSGTDVKVGLQAHYRFLPQQRLDPWIGIGAGYEWLHVSESLGERNAGATLHGFELFNVQAGADYQVCKGFSAGPFAALSFGEYRTESVSTSAGSEKGERSSGIDNTSVHEWLTLGLRGRFDL